MHLAGLNPFEHKPTVKIFGERNTATVYLEWLLRHNLKVELADYWTLGWRHRLAPAPAEIGPQLAESLVFLVLAKNPYSWLLSMHRKPYQHEELKQLPLSRFVAFPYGDYASPLAMWNQKYRAYLAMQGYVRHFALLRYEDLLARPQQTLEQLAERFGMAKGFQWFVNEDRTLTNHHGTLPQLFHKEYYLEEKWKKEWPAELRQAVAAQPDPDLMQRLGYEILA